MERHGLAPTVQELQLEFGFRSPNAVQTHLLALEKKGVLERRGHRARALRVLGNARATGSGWGRPVPAQQTNIRDVMAHFARTVELRAEMGVDVFFNAKHVVSDEFDGEIHAHSWRLQAVGLVGNADGDAPPSVGSIQRAVQEVVGQVEGVVMNKLEPFLTVEPTLERVATWLSGEVATKVSSLGVPLRSVTVWDEPTRYVTTSPQRGTNEN